MRQKEEIQDMGPWIVMFHTLPRQIQSYRCFYFVFYMSLNLEKMKFENFTLGEMGYYG